VTWWQRTPEIGIRIALGATPSDVRNMVIIHGLKLVLAGLVVGIGTAFGLNPATQSHSSPCLFS
jgi:ABC-type antimicrobial peptide transport system permease subunit